MMRRALIYALVGLGLPWAAAACAQGPRAHLHQMLESELENYMSVSIVGGRISGHMTNDAGMQSSSESDSEGVSERFSIASNDGGGEIRYERTSKEDKFTVEITSNEHFSLRSKQKGKSSGPSIQFEQTPGQPLVLSIERGGREKTYRAPSLWHLFLAQPDECWKLLFPALEFLPCHAKMTHIAVDLEPELLKAAANSKPPDRQRWIKLVQQLGDNEYGKRETADRALRAADPSVIFFLQHLDVDQLDAEQQFRVRRIVQAFHATASADTASQIASRLVADPSVWISLLNRPEESTRRAAAKQLASLLGEPIGVDPAADPATQQGQREQLRSRIERATSTSGKP
jgi:hypothetical protein